MKWEAWNFENGFKEWILEHDEMRGINGLEFDADDIRNPYFNNELNRWECDAWDAKCSYTIYLDEDGNIQIETDGYRSCNYVWYITNRKIKILEAAGYTSNTLVEYNLGMLDVIDVDDYIPAEWENYKAEEYKTLAGDYMILSAK